MLKYYFKKLVGENIETYCESEPIILKGNQLKYMTESMNKFGALVQLESSVFEHFNRQV